ncbi:S8 family peptidase [Paenibacillus chungangensis]
MSKYTVMFHEEYDESIKQQLLDSNATINYEDDFLKDFVVIETEDINKIRALSIVKGIEDIAVFSLLDIPKAQSHKMKTVPTPIIDTSLLTNQGRYGLGVKVAVIDSGYTPEANGSIEAAENFTSAVTTEDSLGHGTIVITLLKTYAPVAKIYSAKVSINDNDIDEEYVYRALKWIRSLDDVKVINMSIGVERDCQGLCNLSRVINKMVDQGYVIVAAVGNTGGLTHCPACSEKAISVGALNRAGDNVASFSCKGHTNSTKPDLLTSGYGITQYQGITSDYHGTSFAAPIVAGIVGANVSMIKDTQNVKQYLMMSCDPILNVRSSKQGAGKLNLSKLLEVISYEEENNT